jgi:hypothetical protein
VRYGGFRRYKENDMTVQVEFASPQELLRKEGSFFKAMVDQSADREILYAMAAC